MGWGLATASAGDEDILDFSHTFYYYSTTYAPGGTHPCNSVTKFGVSATACLPDQYADYCGHVDKESKALADRNEARLAPVRAVAEKAQVQALREVTAELGPLPSPDSAGARAYRRKFTPKYAARVRELSRGEMNGLIDKTLGAGQQNMLKAVKLARGLMTRLVTESPRWKAYRETLQGFISCSHTLVLDNYDLHRNASMQRGFSVERTMLDEMEHVRDGDDVILVSNRSTLPRKPLDGAAHLVNPLARDGALGCVLTVTPKTWLACAEGEQSCLRTLLHEFGHLLNSCRVLDVEHYTKQYRHTELGVPDTEELGKRDQFLKFLQDQSHALGHELVEATACLAGFSQPHDALPNSCKPKVESDDLYLRHCGDTALDDYPSQWDEAEADFWAASGVALWLGDRFPKLTDRSRAFEEMWTQFCAEEQVELRSQQNAPPELKTLASWLNDVQNSPLNSASSGCVDKPLDHGRPLPKPWLSPHQSIAQRANRNYMRNSDLRRVLGCQPNEPKIPMTCSPLQR